MNIDPNPLEDAINLIKAEEEHWRAVNHCFIYFQALAETRRRGAVSDLFECLPPNFPTDCDDKTASRIHRAIVDFIDECPSHPNVGACFRTLACLNASNDLQSYLIEKLKLFYAQGNAFNVYQICTVLEDLGAKIFRDENGQFMMSRSSCDAEINMGVARRYLAQLTKQAQR